MRQPRKPRLRSETDEQLIDELVAWLVDLTPSPQSCFRASRAILELQERGRGEELGALGFGAGPASILEYEGDPF